MRNKLFVRKTSQMKNKWAIYSIFALIFPILLIAIACTSGDSEPTPESAMEPTQSPEQLSVITTIYPMTYFSQRVGGERVNVESLIKAGVDAHDFEPTSGDIIKIGEADVLVFNHPAFESWVQDAVVAAENESLIVVKAADIADDAVLAHAHDHGHDEHDDKEAKLVEQLSHVIEEVEHGDISADDGLVEIEEVLHQFEGDHEGHDDHESHEDAEHKEDDDHEAHEDEHAHDEHLDELIEQLEEIVRRTETGAVSADAVIEEIESILGEHGHDEDEHGHDEDEKGIDPHLWLNPMEAIDQVRAIQTAFSDADPVGAKTYAQNADSLVAELTALDDSFKAGLSSCELDHIIVSHKAYGHLAERYSIEQIGLQGLSTEGEPLPKRVAQIVDAIGELGIMHVLQEPIAGSPLVETVAKETGSEVLPLHPMESLTPAELNGGATYFTIMNQNLESLRLALNCN